MHGSFQQAAPRDTAASAATIDTPAEEKPEVRPNRCAGAVCRTRYSRGDEPQSTNGLDKSYRARHNYKGSPHPKKVLHRSS
jgi:hypothetical protein